MRQEGQALEQRYWQYGQALALAATGRVGGGPPAPAAAPASKRISPRVSPHLDAMLQADLQAVVHAVGILPLQVRQHCSARHAMGAGRGGIGGVS
jgi:hypothetical protein